MSTSIITGDTENVSIVATNDFLGTAAMRVAVQLGHDETEAIDASCFDLLADFLFMMLENCQGNQAGRIRAIAKRARRRDIIANAAMLRERNESVRFFESLRITRGAFAAMADSETSEVESLILEVRSP